MILSNNDCTKHTKQKHKIETLQQYSSTGETDKRWWRPSNCIHFTDDTSRSSNDYTEHCMFVKIDWTRPWCWWVCIYMLSITSATAVTAVGWLDNIRVIKSIDATWKRFTPNNFQSTILERLANKNTGHIWHIWWLTYFHIFAVFVFWLFPFLVSAQVLSTPILLSFCCCCRCPSLSSSPAELPPCSAGDIYTRSPQSSAPRHR